MGFDIKEWKELDACLEQALIVNFHFADFQAKDAVAKLKAFTSNFRTGLFMGIEAPYVDKLFRDAFYHYYGSKLKSYERDCIRLSFFNTAITLSDFHSSEGRNKLQEHFLGFLVLRPTVPNIIGRNVFRPDIFQKAEVYHYCVTRFDAAINGIKLEVEGFSHASQDAEYMVCAETTIWSIMEYFSNRYAEYRPILPSKIHGLLSSTSMQRQIPSAGLSGLQISFALKELGFGVKHYTLNSHTKADLFKMIQIYVESGIPLIVAIQNTTGIAHVMNVIGRTNFTPPADFTYTPIEKLSNGSELYDYYEKPANYLVIDDNHPPYSIITLDEPACNYANSSWRNCVIVAAIVPLYQRIYMEADRARNLATQIIKSLDKKIKLPSLVIRVLLSSSRSFKHAISLNPDLDQLTKTLIVNLNMPKFVWIAEVGTIDAMAHEKATGMILMDATEPKKPETLAYLLENSYIGPVNGKLGYYSLPLRPFAMHQNLKPF